MFDINTHDLYSKKNETHWAPGGALTGGGAVPPPGWTPSTHQALWKNNTSFYCWNCGSKTIDHPPSPTNVESRASPVMSRFVAESCNHTLPNKCFPLPPEWTSCEKNFLLEQRTEKVLGASCSCMQQLFDDAFICLKMRKKYPLNPTLNLARPSNRCTPLRFSPNFVIP